MYSGFFAYIINLTCIWFCNHLHQNKLLTFNHSEMNKKVLFDFGKGVLVVIVGLFVYDTVKPMISKAKLSAPTTK